MNTEISHLTANAAALLGEADKQRIRAIRSRRWLVYPRAKQVLDRLNLLVDHPRGTRMPSIAIYGDSGMGKTMIMKRFRDQHPPSFNSLTGRLKTPVLAMEMTSRPGERRFYAELLTLLGAPQRPRADIAQMEQAALRIMEAIGVQVLVIDEVHNILAGTYREQRIVLNTLRFLSNRLQISLVCFGVNDAREAIGGDVQLARRFEQFTLAAGLQMSSRNLGRLDPAQHATASPIGANRKIIAADTADQRGHHCQHLPHNQLTGYRGDRKRKRADYR
nr:TniB family NTP-binding protein [Sinorhizobium medicae]